MFDDEEDYPQEGGCLGVGGVQTISERGVRKSKAQKNPIGFVHFHDKPKAKVRRVPKPKPKPKLKSKRRKR